MADGSRIKPTLRPSGPTIKSAHQNLKNTHVRFTVTSELVRGKNGGRMKKERGKRRKKGRKKRKENKMQRNSQGASC